MDLADWSNPGFSPYSSLETFSEAKAWIVGLVRPFPKGIKNKERYKNPGLRVKSIKIIPKKVRKSDAEGILVHEIFLQ